MNQTVATRKQLIERLDKLEKHLAKENPVLLQIVRSFRELDKVGYKLGLLPQNDSFASRVPWWPMISILGTYSSGKSSFINHYFGSKIQHSGNQAVDDKFTVICFGGDIANRTLPGRALDADPRFPFYQISKDIDSVSEGEGRRVDSYIQLKTSASEKLKGKIFIDSPGFDADDQRTATLRITDHIMDLSDLVLILFDARHPEPGAMKDTLKHLVANTINRHDANKFLYILNQIDTSAREDNPERVFSSWQRALSQYGLTAGRFFSIYNPDLAVPIEDKGLERRFKEKRDSDMEEIEERIHQVEVDRAYRVIGVLEQTANTIEGEWIPRLKEVKKIWRKRVLWTDAIVFSLLGLGILGTTWYLDYWDGFTFAPPWLPPSDNNKLILCGIVIFGLLFFFALHHLIRRIYAKILISRIKKTTEDLDLRERLINAFVENTRFFRSVLFSRPKGWSKGTRKRLNQVQLDTDQYIQKLNDQFTDPSGKEVPTLLDSVKS